jgi:predicted regulator of Ras-like GTPase activity (Roadblock/LC7/MglB family)
MSTTGNEAKRDQVESAFTPMLRKLRDASAAVMAAVFVDTEGECIDYVSEIEPYDAKVAAAHMLIMMEMFRGSSEKVALGEPLSFEISADQRDLWVIRIADEYVLVVVLRPGADRAELRSALVATCVEFRREVGIDAPRWEGGDRRLSVRVRPSPGWRYAPEAYSAEGVRVVIDDVLGRWTEDGGVGGEELVCFRVRTSEGRELTLVHDPDVDGWIVRD